MGAKRETFKLEFVMDANDDVESITLDGKPPKSDSPSGHRLTDPVTFYRGDCVYYRGQWYCW